MKIFFFSCLSFCYLHFVYNLKLENSIKAKARHESYTTYLYANISIFLCLIPICLYF